MINHSLELDRLMHSVFIGIQGILKKKDCLKFSRNPERATLEKWQSFWMIVLDDLDYLKVVVDTCDETRSMVMISALLDDLKNVRQVMGGLNNHLVYWPDVVRVDAIIDSLARMVMR